MLRVGHNMLVANWNLPKSRFNRHSKFTAAFLTFAISMISLAQGQPIERFSTGLIPVKPDDIKNVTRPPNYRAFIDQSVDLSYLFPTPGDQGSQGSCAAWAVGYAARAYWSRKLENRDTGNNANIPSPTYIFNRSRGSASCKDGSSIANALSLLRDVGSLSLRQLPYDEKYCRAIPASLEAQVDDFRINGWSYIAPSRTDVFLDNVKGAIQNRQPVIIGMRLYCPRGDCLLFKLRAGQIYKNSDAPEQFADDANHGFHAMTVVGFDERRQAFKVINSWKTSWADGGFGWIDYETFKSNVDEAWLMQVADPTPPLQLKPTISAFSAHPERVRRGQSAILSWSISGATSVQIDQGIGAVRGNSIAVSPANGTIYTLTAENGAGRATAYTKVFVDAEITSAPSCILSVKPSSIVRGETAILTFTSNNSSGGRIDNGVGAVGPSGTHSITASATTTFTGFFSGVGSETICKATLEVRNAPAPSPMLPSITSFEAAPTSIATGESTTLSWSISGADLVRIDNGVGVVTGSSVKVVPKTTTRYHLTAENSAGLATADLVVQVASSENVVLPDVECGKLALSKRSGRAVVDGFVGSDADLETLKKQIPSADINVKVRPWPQCEALQTLDVALSRRDPPSIAVRRISGDQLNTGDPLVFDVRTPQYPSYLHVAYIQADGSVVNLVQPGDGSFRTYAPDSKIVIGDASANGRRFFVQGPYGREMLIVLVGKSPIFPDRRPPLETEREFLTALRRALLFKSDPNGPEREIAASFDAIVTREK
jgi:hypothetical protein